MPPNKPRDTKFDSLRFVEEISISRLTVVWKGVIQSDGEEITVAYKTVPNESWDSGHTLDHIITETSVLDKLRDCEGVPTLLDHGTIPRPWLAIRFIEEESLHDTLSEKPLRDCIKILKTTCMAIQCAHQRDIVHGDLKPGNIITSTSDPNTTLVLDWGGAKEPPENTSDAFTLPYAAPEQLSDDPISPQTDIYQLGVLAYELITKIKPFQGETEGELRSSILTEDPTPIHLVASDQQFERLSGVLESALAKDPSERYLSVEEFYTDLIRAMKSVGIRKIQSEILENDVYGVAFPDVDSSTFTELVKAAQAGYDVDTISLADWDVFAQIEQSLQDARKVCSNSECESVQYVGTHQRGDYCSRCGEPLVETSTNLHTETTVVDKSSGTHDMKGSVFCPNCGANNSHDDDFCSECGSALVGDQPEEDSDTIIRQGETLVGLGGGVDPQLILHLIEAGVIIIQGSEYAKSAAEYAFEYIEDIKNMPEIPIEEAEKVEELSKEELKELFEEYQIDEDIEWN